MQPVVTRAMHQLPCELGVRPCELGVCHGALRTLTFVRAKLVMTVASQQQANLDRAAF